MHFSLCYATDVKTTRNISIIGNIRSMFFIGFAVFSTFAYYVMEKCVLTMQTEKSCSYKILTELLVVNLCRQEQITAANSIAFKNGCFSIAFLAALRTMRDVTRTMRSCARFNSRA